MMKILPVSKPIIRSYPYSAHICSVVGSHSQFYLPWIYNYFVQLYTAKEFEYEKRVDYITPSQYDYLPGLVTRRVSREIAFGAGNGILGFVRNCINHGYYIYGLFDVSQIAVYNLDHFWMHDPMLYGYDDKNEEIYFADNYMHGKYSLGITSYEGIVRATENMSKREDLSRIDWMSGFWCIKYNAGATPFQFNKSMYEGLLSDYLNQQDSRYRWMQPWEIRRGWQSVRWGIGVYSVMREYLLYVKEKNKCLDKRCFFVEMEHKQLIEKTITYLLGIDWKTMYPEEWKLLEKDIKLTTIMMNLCLKYNFTLDKKLLDSIGAYLIDLETNDKQLFPCLINLVANYVPDKEYICTPGVQV